MDSGRDSSGRLVNLSRDARNRCGWLLTPTEGVPFACPRQHPRPETSERVATRSSRPARRVAVALAADRAFAAPAIPIRSRETQWRGRLSFM